MGAPTTLSPPSSAPRGIDAPEWEARLELAAAYRLVAHYGWTHLIQNHITLRVPGRSDQFLINPYGLLYEQITASSLIKVDRDGRALQETEYPINPAGFVIHSAVHEARPDLNCVMHTHTVAGQAVSALDCGILPLHQSAMRYHNRVGYHEFEGVADRTDERERIARDLGGHKVLVLRHHGLLTAGRTVAEAFHLLYHLEKTCETQMQVLASNQRFTTPAEHICEATAARFHRPERVLGEREWPALRELVAHNYPDFAR